MKSLFTAVALMVILLSCQKADTNPVALLEDEPIQRIILPGDYLVALDTLGKVSWVGSRFASLNNEAPIFYDNNFYSRYTIPNTNDKNLERFDPKTGEIIKPTLNIPQSEAPEAIYDNKILTFTNVGKILVSDITTGKLIWEINERYNHSKPIINNGVIYLLQMEKHLMSAVDFKTGKILWQTPTGDNNSKGPYESYPIIVGNKIIVPTYFKIIAFDLLNGKKVWEYAQNTTLNAPMGYSSGMLAFDAESEVKVLDTNTGKLKWTISKKPTRKMKSPYFYKNTLFVVDEESIFAYEKETGKSLWNAKLKESAVQSNLVAGNGTLYVYHDSNLTAFNSKTGAKKWEFQLENERNYYLFQYFRSSLFLFTQTGKIIQPNR